MRFTSSITDYIDTYKNDDEMKHDITLTYDIMKQHRIDIENGIFDKTFVQKCEESKEYIYENGNEIRLFFGVMLFRKLFKKELMHFDDSLFTYIYKDGFKGSKTEVSKDFNGNLSFYFGHPDDIKIFDVIVREAYDLFGNECTILIRNGREIMLDFDDKHTKDTFLCKTFSFIGSMTLLFAFSAFVINTFY